MFKWCCLAVAAVALVAFGWMINDTRLEIRRVSERVNQHLPQILEKAEQATRTANEHLPPILEKTQQATKTVTEHLPTILERTNTATQTFAEIAEDVRQLKQLAGLASTARDSNLVAYANSVLALIEAQDARIGVKRVGGAGLTSPVPAKEWTVAARKEALVLTAVVKSRQEFLDRLSQNLFHRPWHIQFASQEPQPLRDWLRAHHPESKGL